MVYRLKLADYARMSEEDRAQAVVSLVEAAREPRAHIRDEIKRRIREFEIRYEVSSADLITELREERRKETAEIAEWLFLIDALDHCVTG